MSAWLDTLPLLGYFFVPPHKGVTHTHTVERLWTFDIWLVVLLSAVWKKKVGHLEYNNRWRRTLALHQSVSHIDTDGQQQLNRTKKIKNKNDVARLPNVKSIVRTMANTKLITCSPAGLSLWSFGWPLSRRSVIIHGQIIKRRESRQLLPSSY